MLPWEHASREGFATRNTLFYLRRAELSTGPALYFRSRLPAARAGKPGRRATVPDPESDANLDKPGGNAV